MTTIAWDGKEVACDSIVTAGGGYTVPGERAKKVLELPDGTLFCGSGHYSNVLRVYEWMCNGKKDPAPTVKDVAFLLVTASGCEFMDENLLPEPLTTRYYSIGSGQDFAHTAMELGKTAKQAVAIAMKFDRKSGGQIHVFQPKKVVKKRSRKTLH